MKSLLGALLLLALSSAALGQRDRQSFVERRLEDLAEERADLNDRRSELRERIQEQLKSTREVLSDFEDDGDVRQRNRVAQQQQVQVPPQQQQQQQVPQRQTIDVASLVQLLRAQGIQVEGEAQQQAAPQAQQQQRQQQAQTLTLTQAQLNALLAGQQ